MALTDLEFSYDYILEMLNGYLLATGVFLGAMLGLKIFKSLVISRLKKLSKKTKTDVDNLAVDIVDSIGWSFFTLLSAYAALQFAPVPAVVVSGIYYALVLVGTYYAVKAAGKMIDYAVDKAEKMQKEEGNEVAMLQTLRKAGKAAVWVMAVLMVFQNLGYDVSALLAGVGIGGIAIAFAFQNILEDIFASFSIYFDKPFEVGDYIAIGDDGGTVQQIGIKTTRLKTLKGQELVVSNKELTSARINNYKKMEERRVTFKFGVTYETSLKKLEKIPGIIKEIVDGIKDAELNRVHFKEMGDFSLVYEVVYYVKDSSYSVAMDIQQEMNLEILNRLKKMKVELAYPTQKVFVAK